MANISGTGIEVKERSGRRRPRWNAVSHWDHVDFERLYKVLRLAAESAVREAPESFNMGHSASDLAHETFSAFLNSPTALGWNPARGSVEKFLVGVLWKKAQTHLRRDRKVGGSLDDPKSSYAPARINPVFAEIEFKDLRKKICEAVGDDQDLCDLITATEQISGDHNVNQQLARLLGKPVREVVNLKRRLLKNQKVLSFLWPKKNM